MYNNSRLITCSKRSLVKHVNPWADYDERNSDQMSLNGDDPTLLPMEMNNFHYYDPFFKLTFFLNKNCTKKLLKKFSHNFFDFSTRTEIFFNSTRRFFFLASNLFEILQNTENKLFVSAEISSFSLLFISRALLHRCSLLKDILHHNTQQQQRHTTWDFLSQFLLHKSLAVLLLLRLLCDMRQFFSLSLAHKVFHVVVEFSLTLKIFFLIMQRMMLCIKDEKEMWVISLHAYLELNYFGAFRLSREET